MKGRRIGIVGGGQLGQMLTLAALELGHTVTVLDPTPDSPSQQVGATQIIGKLTDEDAIRQLARKSDVVTFEIEHINTTILKTLAKEGSTVHPSPETLEMIKDKYQQKVFLQKSGIPTCTFASVDSATDIKKVAGQFGYPLVLKTRLGGYDGRGNAVIHTEKEIDEKIKILRKDREKLYVEQFVDFEKEIAVIVARSTSGDIRTYPVVESINKDNICHTVLAPASITKSAEHLAETLAKKVMQHLGGAGVFGIEMFLTKNDSVLINEIAPRVHNTGHYTIEACKTSQFKQHILAITGSPLEETAMIVKAAVMINILGDRTGKAIPTGVKDAMFLPQVYIHFYGKAETRPQRKMGHITILGDNIDETKYIAEQARKMVSI